MLICPVQQILAPTPLTQKCWIRASGDYTFQDCELVILPLMSQLTLVANRKRLKPITILSGMETPPPPLSPSAKTI